MRLSTGNIDAGKPIALLDVIVPQEVRLASVEGRVAKIVWRRNFSDATITIDVERKVFEYRAEGGLADGVGLGVCQ